MVWVEAQDVQSTATMVAAVAAFVAAVTSVFIAGRMTRRAKIAEFRQAWINKLRADIADYLAGLERYRAVYEDVDDGERDSRIQAVKDETRSTYYQIVLRMNPWPNANEKADEEFLCTLQAIVATNGLKLH